MKIIYAIRNISFWGIFFLIIIISLFQVPFSSVYSNIFISNSSTHYMSLFLILSIPVFIICTVIDIIHSNITKLSFFDMFIIALPTLVWTPYKGFDIRSLIKSFKSGKCIFQDIINFIFNLILMIIWWFIVIYGIVVINNGLNSEMSSIIKSGNVIKNLFIIIIIIIIMNIISTILFKLGTSSWSGEYRFNKNKGTIGQRYYERHPEHMPAACKACGGPYPECRGSCNVFDE